MRLKSENTLANSQNLYLRERYFSREKLEVCVCVYPTHKSSHGGGGIIRRWVESKKTYHVTNELNEGRTGGGAVLKSGQPELSKNKERKLNRAI